MSEFQIRKDNYHTNRVVATDLSESDIAAGEVLVKIDKFAFTANNMTYAVVGDQFGYWQFFPPTGNNVREWGILPVWGFADVVASNAENVAVGERLFGYFPPATYLKMTPTAVSEYRWIDGAEHRAPLPSGYNAYRRVLAEPNYNKAMDDFRMLLFPLHITSYCLYDNLQDRNWFGAEQVVVISASSKTSIGLGYALADDENAPSSIGMTSDRNLDMVTKLGIYDSTVTYDNLTSIDPSKPTVIVDMSGNGEVLGRLHKHLGANMKFCSNVGFTHWEDGGMGPDFIQQRSEMFFAPAHIQKRIKDWGSAVFEQKTTAFMQSTIQRSASWLKLTELHGLKGLADVYQYVCEGKVNPEAGLIIKM
ncbi:DUF2855 family protein [Paraglaciecola arctica]|uniref:DUF2855 family protein n=1 Tax=Paraglaciecola arctica TaxID=1128911 RepID=UPI001C0657BB|nr:DUF2855 family protein [Paraglaciecola arctica]MBU3006149.1 DUF2855 family protein [Paraglaciecola arctica]